MKGKLHNPNHAMYEEIRFRREYRWFGFLDLRWRWRAVRTGIFRLLGYNHE